MSRLLGVIIHIFAFIHLPHFSVTNGIVFKDIFRAFSFVIIAKERQEMGGGGV